MGRIIGIDLGTTNTSVAVLQDGRPRVIEDDRGYKVLPSVVTARGEGRFIVGQAAHNLILTSPDRTVYATKRLIGRRFDSPEVQRARARLQYQIKEGPDGMVLVQVGDEWMSPAEVAAVILQVARTITEKALGETVDEAVVTVPAHFNHHQRQETMEAARMAGFRCDRLLNEPTAAALAYGHKKSVNRTVVIFDLGGGTFDLSVLKLSEGVYEVLATSGDTWLGGEDFDYRVVDHLADAFQTKSGIDLRQDKSALQRVKDAAERAKCDLSFSDRTNVVIPHIVAGQNLEAVLTRTTLESLTADLVSRCLEVTRSAVGDAGLALSEIDEVVLVGGQTRMPRVREAVSGLFGREPSRSVHPEDAVAVGAAVHGEALADPTQPVPVLLDVTPFDLGIDSAGGVFSSVIKKNARVPASETRSFATVHEGQTAVRITVRQGESLVAAENEFLGEFVLEGLEAAPRMQTKVDVTFRLDSNGILHVSAVDRHTRETRALSVRNYGERARGARLPTPAEAAKEAARMAAAGGGALPPKAVAPAAAGAAVTKKGGLLAALFGSDTSAKAAKLAPAAAPNQAATAAPPPPPAIDMGAVGARQLGSAPPPETATIVEATLLPEEDGLSASELFGGLDDGVEAAATAPADPAGDPFGGDVEDSEVFGEAIVDEPEEGVLSEELGLGEDEAAGAGFGLMADEDDDDPETAPPPTVEPEPLAPEPAPMRFAQEPARPSTAAQAIQMSNPGLDPFSTGEGGAAAALPVDIFAYESDTAGIEADHVENPFDDSPTFGGEPAGPPAAAARSSSRETPFLPAQPPAAAGRRPARLKMSYNERESFLVEYRGNLRRNGTFIKTQKPLSVGRECIFEVDAPGLVEPLIFSGVVTYISDGSTGEPRGMGVEYRLTELERVQLSVIVAV